MSINNWRKKLLLLFSKIFEDDYELNPYHAEMILKYFETAPVNGLEDTLLETSLFSDIILKTFKKCSVRKNSVKIFIAKVLTKVYKHELQFSKLCEMFDVNRFRSYMCNPGSCAQNSNLLLACINVLTSPIAHYSGIGWLVEHKMWCNVLCACTYTRPVKVSRAAYNFITQLLWKLNELEDEVVLSEIFEFIISPIRNNHYHIMKVIKEGEERNVYAPMLTFLHALLEVLSDTEEQATKINKIVPILTQQFNLELQLQVLLDVTRDPDYARVLCELLFKLCVASAKDAFIKYKKTESEVMNEVTSIFNNVVHKLIMKQMTEAVADFVVNCNVFLAKLCAGRPLIFERDGRKFEFQNQFILHLVVPLWTYYALNCSSEFKLNEIGNYTFKLSNIMAEHIAQSAHFFHTLIGNNSSSMKKITIHTVRNLFRFRGQLNETTAGILYQGLYYVLQTFVILDDIGSYLILSENPLKTPDDFKLLSLVLDAIKLLLKEHHINWYENLEIISLQVTLLNLTKQKFLCTRGLVQTVDLINLSVNKFLSPDMTLLVESKSESSLSEIGAMTKEYIEHDDWEIRESALSLLLTCTDVSFVKYMPLQKIIIKNNLMFLAAKCAFNDPEVYVQATALQCLAAATKIDKIWQNLINIHTDLHVQLVNIVKMRKKEDILRKEAINVLTHIYLNQNVTNQYNNSMFMLMAGVALNDMHWEVQIAALNFWRHAIKQQCLERGMIDGKFPSVTFSKQKRKIIVFNDVEIKRQLSKMMDDLSCIGCLTVLYRCLNEEHNVAVIEEAYKIVKELKELLDHYKFAATQTSKALDNFPTCRVPVEMEVVNVLNTESYVSLDPMFDFREMIIDEIINTKQQDLILDIINRTVVQKGINETENCIKDAELIRPHEFLEKFSSIDYSLIIENKKKCNFDYYSLDDIIHEIINPITTSKTELNI